MNLPPYKAKRLDVWDIVGPDAEIPAALTFQSQFVGALEPIWFRRVVYRVKREYVPAWRGFKAHFRGRLRTVAVTPDPVEVIGYTDNIVFDDGAGNDTITFDGGEVFAGNIDPGVTITAPANKFASVIYVDNPVALGRGGIFWINGTAHMATLTEASKVWISPPLRADVTAGTAISVQGVIYMRLAESGSAEIVRETSVVSDVEILLLEHPR